MLGTWNSELKNYLFFMAEEKKLKILIVDDDKFILSLYAAKFKAGGLDVTTAASGMEAIEKIKSGGDPDIIIADIVMPLMDGIQFLEKLREEKLAEDSIIVMLTNQDQQTDIDRAKKMKVAGYVVKVSTIPSEVVTQVLNIYKERKKLIKS